MKTLLETLKANLAKDFEIAKVRWQNFDNIGVCEYDGTHSLMGKALGCDPRRFQFKSEWVPHTQFYSSSLEIK